MARNTDTPDYAIRVNGEEVDAGIRRLVEEVYYESVDGMADKLQLRISNPDFKISDSLLFQPGNEVDMFVGYRNRMEHVGRAKIYKTRPHFPEGEEASTVEVIAYTRDHEMMKNEPEAGDSTSEENDSGRRDDGRRFTNSKYSDAIRKRALAYGFTLDIDDSPDEPSDFIQKAGMSDYEFCVGLANAIGYYFWVDGDEDGIWTLHFKEVQTATQEKRYEFQYNVGPMSTLLAFHPEFLITESVARIRATYTDPETGEPVSIDVKETDELVAPVTIFPTGGDPSNEVMESEIPSSSAIQLVIGDYSFEEITDVAFTSEEELRAWVSQWFRRQRENFILCRGKTIGVEDLRARQIHKCTGVGTTYSGAYYFSRVKHLYTMDGYIIDFSGRKQLL